MTDRPVFSADQVVGGRFRIVKTLGHGGMGEVYEAFDLELRDSIALKTIKHEIASDPRFIESFKREVQRSRTISHVNVCRVHDLFRERVAGDNDVWFLTMELLRGETLSDRIHREGHTRPREWPVTGRSNLNWRRADSKRNSRQPGSSRLTDMSPRSAGRTQCSG